MEPDRLLGGGGGGIMPIYRDDLARYICSPWRLEMA